jgi:hypothetical protein
VVGALLWTATPWAERAVYGDRPYVGTEFDLLSFVGLLAVGVGVAGFRAAFRSEYGRFGAVGVASTGAGVAVLAALAGRSSLAVVAAGFGAVPATGEDPAGLLLTLAWVLGVGLATLGAGALGAALRRLTGRWTLAAASLLSGLAVPVLVLLLRALSLLPLAVGALVVRTNVVFLPLGLGWVALGAAVRSRVRVGGSEA